MAISTFIHDKTKGKDFPGYGVHGYHETSYEGAVLSTGEVNGYDDSDFFATVWDEASGSIKRVEYATTRGWTYLNGAAVDATPEVREKAAKFYAALALAANLSKAAATARKPEIGKRVKVVKGRNVPKGTEGDIFWVGEGRYFGPVPRYRTGAWSTAAPRRLGIRDDAGTTHWTAETNVEVTNPEEFLPDYADIVASSEWAGRDKAGLIDHNSYRRAS